MHKSLKKIFTTFILAFLSSLAISILSRTLTNDSFSALKNLNNILDDLYISDLAVFTAIWILYQKTKIHKHFLYFCTSSILAFFMIIGKSYIEFNSWDFFFAPELTPLAIISFLGINCLLYIAIQNIIQWLTSNGSLFFKKADTFCIPKSRFHKLINFCQNHLYWVCFLALLLLWLPYIIINFPGSVPYDGYRQINMGLGIQTMSNHHPYIVSVFFGTLFRIGSHISDNVGVFLIILFNLFFSGAIFAYICLKINKMGFHINVSFIVVLFFGCIPMWGSYIQAVLKDTLFIPLFALYIVKLIDLFDHLKQTNQVFLFRYCTYFIVSILLCLVRNDGFYIVLPITLLLTIIVAKSAKSRIFLLSFVLSIFLIWIGYNNILLPAANVEKGSVKEMLSIPFQQTARYIKYYGDELTEEQIHAIDRVLDFEHLAEKYNPNKADAVKDTMKNATSEDLINYFKVWFEMLKIHPGVMLQATLNNTYGYYYPFYKCTDLLTYQYYIETKPAANTGDLDIHYINSNSFVRKLLIDYSDFWQIAPGISSLVSPGFYTWVLILLVVALIKEKHSKELIVLLAPFLRISICMASPVNGLLRYSLPMIAAMPILICWTIRTISLHKTKSTTW